jgi:hypothetical protein
MDIAACSERIAQLLRCGPQPPIGQCRYSFRAGGAFSNGLQHPPRTFTQQV